MDANTIGGIIRAIAAAVGGVLIAKGVTDESTVQAVSGGLTTIIVAVWSYITNRNLPPKA